MSTIIRFEAENIMRLKAVRFAPHTSKNVLGGRNRAGKTSTLSAIAMVLGGADMIPEKPLKVGETEGEIECDIQTDKGVITAKRKFWGPGDGSYTKTTIELTEKRDGRKAKLTSPQALLDGMLGSLTFDPWEIERQRPAEQIARLKELGGVNTDAIDSDIDRVFNERKEANRDAKEAQTLWDTAEAYPDAPAELVSVGALVESLNAANDHNRKGEELAAGAREAARRTRETGETMTAKAALVAKLERQLADAREEHAEATQRAEAAVNAEAAANELRDAFVGIDTAPIRQQMGQVEEINAKVRANIDAAKKRAASEAANAKAKELTDQLEVLRGQRSELMAKANWPVDGLGFDEAKGITLNGLPLDQAAESERKRLWAGLAFASAKGLPVALVKDASLMDDDAWDILMETCEKYGGQVFAEVVVKRGGDESECTLIIEDGESREPHTEAEAA